MNVNCTFAFPIPIIDFNIDSFPQFRDDLINHIYDVKSQSSGVQVSNNGGWQSDDTQIPHQFASALLGNTVSVIEQFLDGKHTVNVYNTWYNVNPPGSSNDRHTHPCSDLSAVCYVKTTGADSGLIEFENPNNFTQFKLLDSVGSDVAERAQMSHATLFTPKEGTVIVFPADLRHRVLTNNTDEDRISIAWNMRIIDKQ